MAFGLKRSDLQTLARGKLDDAEFLLQHGRYANAYYLAGYAVELGLKAVIAKSIKGDVIPDKAYVAAIYDHDLRNLVDVAGLRKELEQTQQANTMFATNWALVTRWNPVQRYEMIPAVMSQVTIAAIAHHQDGVFPWIQQYW